MGALWLPALAGSFAAMAVVAFARWPHHRQRAREALAEGNRAEAPAIVKPLAGGGRGGAGGGRAHGYNVEANGLETRRWLNQQTLVIPMCEETEAVANIDSIVAVPGVDVVHVAAGDLGQSMGNADPAEVRRVMTDVVRRVRAAGKYAGIGGNSPTDPAGVAELIGAGATFVTISAAGLLRVGAELFRERVEAAIAARE